MVLNPTQWTCRFCGRHAVISTLNSSSKYAILETHTNFTANKVLHWTAITCPNPECNELSLEVFTTGLRMTEKGHWVPEDLREHRWTLLPTSRAKPLPDYIPEEIRNNYREAYLILNDSPKASAAMSRRCLQGMVRDFWDIPASKRGNLGAEISFISDKINQTTLDTIIAIREIGDIGAHMEKSVDTIVDVEPDEAELLLKLIETLIDDWYIDRHNRQSRHSKLTEIVGQKREAKKQAKESLKSPSNATEN